MLKTRRQQKKEEVGSGGSATEEELPCFFREAPGSGVRICTSGYSYDFWHAEGSFYSGVPAKREFEVYSREFDAVELNATFYRQWGDETFDKWKAQADAVRPSFEYIVKANRYFTHMKRLNVDDAFKERWQQFWGRCQRLGSHLGPVLFQFRDDFPLHPAPPKKKKSAKKKKGKKRGRAAAAEKEEGEAHAEQEEGEGEEGAESTTAAAAVAPINLARLEALGEVLSPEGRYVFEFRHSSWYCPQVYEVMRRHNWCLALVEVSGRRKEESLTGEKAWCATMRKGPNPAPADYPLDTSSWGAYIRYHGSKGKYVGKYGERRMGEWAQRVQEWTATGRRVYAAFNNTDDGTPPSAIADARALAEALRHAGIK